MNGILRVQLYLYPQLPFEGDETLAALLDAFEAHASFAPTHWSPSETARVAYNRQEILARTNTGADSISAVYLYRAKGTKYDGHFDFTKFPFFSFQFDKSMAADQWPQFLNLADRVAAAAKVRFGIAHIFRPCVMPWVTEEDRLRLQMSFTAQPIPVRFRKNGPLGLGMRTYFGGDILDMFGRDLLLSTPGVVKTIGGKGIRIDLTEDLWNADDAVILNRWTAAMDHLSPARATAVPILLKSGRGFDFAPSPAWEKLPKKWNHE
jgi:hypothetical protein